MASQATDRMKKLMLQRLQQLPGPRGAPENEDYMVELMDECDALAMYDSTGGLMWAWSQDQMNGWYWHVDVEDAPLMHSTESYTFVQGDGSKIQISNESDMVAKFIAGNITQLFFNGCKFHMTQQDTSSSEGVLFLVMGGQHGRGLHCAVSPDREYMIVAAASSNPLPSEKYMGLESKRPMGQITRDARELGGIFRKCAPDALGV